jgi:GST-like protein
MIDVYYFPTPNGHKIPLFLEETGLKYTIRPVNILKGEQLEPAFLKINPNNKIPAIVDHETGVTVFESGAILQYLADKTGRFHGKDLKERVSVNEWLFWQVGGLGPMLGQLGHFVKYAKEKVPYAIQRYTDEYTRLAGVMNKRLSETPFLAGAEYTIADMACYSWSLQFEPYGISVGDAVKRWQRAIGERPATIRAMAIKIAPLS